MCYHPTKLTFPLDQFLGEDQCQAGLADIAMLRLLSVTNFATIEQLEMEMAPRFNVLTGKPGPVSPSSWMR